MTAPSSKKDYLVSSAAEAVCTGGRSDGHIHIVRTIWAQTYHIKKIIVDYWKYTYTRYVYKYGVGRGGRADIHTHKKKPQKTLK